MTVTDNPFVEAFNSLFGIEKYNTLRLYMKSGNVVKLYVTEYTIKHERGGGITGLEVTWAKRAQKAKEILIFKTIDLEEIEYVTVC